MAVPSSQPDAEAPIVDGQLLKPADRWWRVVCFVSLHQGQHPPGREQVSQSKVHVIPASWVGGQGSEVVGSHLMEWAETITKTGLIAIVYDVYVLQTTAAEEIKLLLGSDKKATSTSKFTSTAIDRKRFVKMWDPASGTDQMFFNSTRVFGQCDSVPKWRVHMRNAVVVRTPGSNSFREPTADEVVPHQQLYTKAVYLHFSPLSDTENEVTTPASIPKLIVLRGLSPAPPVAPSSPASNPTRTSAPDPAPSRRGKHPAAFGFPRQPGTSTPGKRKKRTYGLGAPPASKTTQRTLFTLPFLKSQLEMPTNSVLEPSMAPSAPPSSPSQSAKALKFIPYRPPQARERVQERKVASSVSAPETNTITSATSVSERIGGSLLSPLAGTLDFAEALQTSNEIPVSFPAQEVPSNQFSSISTYSDNTVSESMQSSSQTYQEDTNFFEDSQTSFYASGSESTLHGFDTLSHSEPVFNYPEKPNVLGDTRVALTPLMVDDEVLHSRAKRPHPVHGLGIGMVENIFAIDSAAPRKKPHFNWHQDDDDDDHGPYRASSSQQWGYNSGSQ